MQPDSYDHGVPSWVDLGTPDLPGTAAFYGSLFGWDCPEGPAEAGGYRVCTLNGRTVAGLGPQMNPDFPPAWLTYVDVDDADAAAAAVGAAGGNALMPVMDVMEAGRMGLFADTSGAVFGIWQPGQHPGAGIVNEPGALCWNELVSTDLEASLAFYPKVFGWGVSPQPPEGPLQYGEWKLADRTIGGVMPKPPGVPAEVPSYWGVYFAVTDTDEAVAKATGLGATLLMPPTDIEPGRFAMLVDPVGATFSVIALSEARSQ
jgi:predicted enzyme related to lactoylglutathione lyase